MLVRWREPIPEKSLVHLQHSLLEDVGTLHTLDAYLGNSLWQTPCTFQRTTMEMFGGDEGCVVHKLHHTSPRSFVRWFPILDQYMIGRLKGSLPCSATSAQLNRLRCDKNGWTQWWGPMKVSSYQQMNYWRGQVIFMKYLCFQEGGIGFLRLLCAFVRSWDGDIINV